MSAFSPFNPLVCAALTDLYQITTVYAQWKAGKHEQPAVFELFFRKCPFGGEYAVFAGLQEVLGLLSTFHFSAEDIAYLREQIPYAEDAFFDWLSTVNADAVEVYSMREGEIVFPREPLMSVRGPLFLGHLLETPILNLVNFASLVATNAARIRGVVASGTRLIEGGLRRAQGPDGALSASYYAHMGGFDSTSNVLAGRMFRIPVGGTFPHAFVSSFSGLEELSLDGEFSGKKSARDFVDAVLRNRRLWGFEATNSGELAAFIAFAMAHPKRFTALVDTYDTLRSGVPNFLCVAAALWNLGFRSLGIRLDSGDLAYLSKEVRVMFQDKTSEIPHAEYFQIVASNDLNEATLLSLQAQGHAIDSFLVGTNVVTCEGQPAFGGVYKLVEIEGRPVIKLSENLIKTTLPGAKQVYRLSNKEDTPLVDILVPWGDPAPVAGHAFLCRHPFEETRRMQVTPHGVRQLLEKVWDKGTIVEARPFNLADARNFVKFGHTQLREDHRRPLNPTPYKVSVSAPLYDRLHKMWQEAKPIEMIE